MKFPSLSRLPSHRRFNVEPRYYDPVKEDIDERTSRIKQEIRQVGEGSSQATSSITGSFARKASYDKNANILQMVIVILMITLIAGYLIYGNDIFYIFLLAVPAYLYIRIRKYSKRR